MKFLLKRFSDKPSFVIQNNYVVRVNKEFINISGYSKDELIGKSLMEIGGMLRVSSQICLPDLEGEFRGYMFNKKCEPREVVISCNNLKEYENEKTFFITEKEGFRIDKAMQYEYSLISNSEIGTGIYDVEYGIIIKVNPKIIDFWNAEESLDYSGESIAHICSNIKEYEINNIFSEVIKTGKPIFRHEMKLVYSGRGDHYWDVSVTPISVSGKIKYIIHHSIDETERVRNRLIVEQQNLELEAIIESMTDAMVIYDKAGSLVKTNKACREMFQAAKEDLKTIEDTFDHVSYYDANGSQILKDNFHISSMITREEIQANRIDIKINNNMINTEVSYKPICDKEGSFVAGVIFARDITERIENEENKLIEAQNEILAHMVDNLELGLIRFTYPEFKVIDVNQTAYNQMKQLCPGIGSKVSLIGQTAVEIMEGKVELLKIMNGNLNSDKCYRFVKHNIAGEEVYRKYLYQPLFGLNNEIIEMIVIGIDVNEEIQAKIRMEEALKIQDEVFANISHELKTPLNVIFSTNQVMEFYLKNGLLEENMDKVNRSISIIKQNCYRFTKLINNIVDLSKIDSGFFKLNLRNENIVVTVENIVQSVADYVEGKCLSIVFDTDIEEKIIAYDAEKIERIVLNLISNAIKFSDPDSQICVNVIDKGEFVEINVKDYGVGIEEKNLDSIFTRFHQVDKTLTRNAEGSGIGLSLVKSLVDLHGGSIRVDSEVGSGSVFRVELPAVRIETLKELNQVRQINNKIEMINIEFSDIYQL